MKKIQIAIMGAALIMAVQARATLYDFTFTGVDNATTATGQVEVNSGGIATSGSIDVTYQQGTTRTTIGFDALWPVTGGVIENSNGDETWGSDNVFNPRSTTQDGFLSFNGLIFYNTLSNGSVGGWVWFGNDSPGNAVPQLVTSGNSPYGFGYFTPYTDGTLTVVPHAITPVPEPTTMVAGAMLLIPFGMSALRMLRKSHTA